MGDDSNDASELLSANLDQGYDKAEQQQIETFLDNTKGEKEFMIGFRDEYRTAVNVCRLRQPALLQKAGKSCLRQVRKVVPRKEGSNRKYPKSLPVDLVAKDMRDLLPPRATLAVDHLENRFRGSYFTGATCSRSWTLHGEAESFRQIAQWSWALHTELTGEVCPITGIVDHS